MECAWCERPMDILLQYIIVVERDEEHQELEEYTICSSKCLRKWAE
tara:strand:+ start:365 stop:502 length:138 start_codon:yes stop_codon:yes gene_type:complete